MTAEAIQPPAPEKIAPALLGALARPAETHLPIIVMMQDQADLVRLEVEIIAEGVDRRARAERVIDRLKGVAARTQPPLRAELDRWRTAGAVRAVTPLWIINAIILGATPEVVVEIAERADVARVYLDSVIETDRAHAAAAGESEQAGLFPGQAEPGLRVVAAPALWDRGITGAGVIVMNLDTGVDGNHPSMSERWLGNEPDVLASDAWFDHPINQACPTPCDYDFHGTLVLSAVTGLETATADTIGVAFGSRWIAGAVVGASTGHVLTAFEWAAEAPGGTRPPADVLNLSIQDPSVGIAGDCGPNGTYWGVVDAFEAIGGAIVWAAGNEGPGPQTINHPKNRITTMVNMFTVGNISPHSPTFPIHSTSGRGPSICDGLTPKPEVVAPGTTIRVATPGGGYGSFSGTSLAAPHAAGVIALLMEAFPWATGTDIKFALLASAVDLGDPGDDNTYGMGLIDASAAYDLLQSAATVDDAEVVSPTARVLLSEARPNPFNPATSLGIELSEAARVTLRVYSPRGELVAAILDQEDRPAGHHDVTWDGRTSDGRPVPSGLYFFRLDTRLRGSGETIRRMRRAVLLK
jgi:bacillopeptidase F